MKKTLFLCMTLSLALLAGCSNSNDAQNSTAGTDTPSENVTTTETPSQAPEDNTPEDNTPVAPDANAATTDLFYGSDVAELEGDWNLAQVYVGDTAYDAVESAASLKIAFELDPSELVDEAAYIHNQVYNLTGDFTFGAAGALDALSADGLEGYRGSTAWSDFPQGEVVEEGQFYKQPGPATMRFKDVDAYGLFLDQLAEGAPADVDTTERTLIIGLNNQGQLLLGSSAEHLERPNTEGEWNYCLVFDKAS